jgi:hypothetical protein
MVSDKKRKRLAGSSNQCVIDVIPSKLADTPSFPNLYFSGPADAADHLVKSRPDQPWLFPGLGSNLGLVTQIASENEANLQPIIPKIEFHCYTLIWSADSIQPNFFTPDARSIRIYE